MQNRFLAILGIGVALLTASSIPAIANDITTATATVSCGPPTGFTAEFSGKFLNGSTQYEVDFKITFTPSTGSPIVKTGSVMIPAHTTGNFAVSASGTVSLTSGVKYTLTGSATLRNAITHTIANTIPILFTNPNQQITCGQQGRFTCRASALRVNELLGHIYEPVVANAPDDPCEEDAKSLLSVVAPLPVVGVISADVLNAITTDAPNTAEGKVASASILGLVTTGVLDAKARVDSVGGNCVLSSNSTVASAVVNGLPITVVANHLDVTIPLVGIVHFNETLGGPHPTSGAVNLNKVTQRALWLQITNPTLQTTTGVKEVIVGEATADFTGNPCSM